MSKHALARPILGAGKPDTLTFEDQPAFDARLFDQISDSKRLAVYGLIKYRGGPKRAYTTRFFWWNSPQSLPCTQGISEELNARD